MWRIVGPALVSLAPIGCSLVFAISDDAASGSRDDAGPSGDEQAAEATVALDDAGDGGVSPLRCGQTGRGPEMVPAGDRLCIDSTPVTQAEYAVFLEAGVPPATQMPGCANNTSFKPQVAAQGPDYPVHAVDWCDAYAFCAWAGKRLCGTFAGADAGIPDDASVDPEGGLQHGLGFGEVGNRAVGAWTYACQGGDRALVYPYGNDLDPAACYSIGGLSPAAMGPVGSRPCEGGFPGLFDMVGNVKEWVDACEKSSCALMGAYDCRQFTLASADVVHQLYDIVKPIGFRCCGVEVPQR